MKKAKFKKLWYLVFLLLVLFRRELSTEQLTLTTYYPAPYGVYNELRTIGNTYLAYTSGRVGIGTNSPTGKLQVTVAGSDRLFINDTNGRVGVGTNSPGDEMEINANTNITSGKHITTQNNSCSIVQYPIPGTTLCPANNYATYIGGYRATSPSGIAQSMMGATVTNAANPGFGYMFCCPN
ncbi:MAG: hypothetical protein HY399_05225 [Elusimicrobia bacterium]|nr:hypothetical protein [Elusimicrobiota bacterium]